MISLVVLATYAVGPAQTYAEVQDVPFESLVAGDVVEIHWRDAPYAAKFVIGDGVTVRGVRGPSGARPVIDGAGATTRAQLDYWNQDRNVIKVGGSSAPADMPTNVVIEGLDVRGGHPDNTFTDASGAVVPYAGNAAAIQIEDGTHITIRDCEISGSANGLFISPGTTDVLVDGNYVHGNGLVGDIYEHNSYTEADGIVFQFNHYGPLAPGAGGNNLKDRSAGQVVRFNWIEGGNRQLDLVDSDVYTALPSYRSTYVYGNVLVEPDGDGNRQIVHYGGDGADPTLYRQGTLYFYGNTVVSTRTDRTTLFRLSSPEETADVRDNIFYVPAGGDTIELTAQDGDIAWGWNWIEPGWSDSFGGATGAITDLGGRVEASDPGFVDAAGQDFHLTATSGARDVGGALAAGALPLDHEVGGGGRAVDSVIDMGAFEYCTDNCAAPAPDGGVGGGDGGVAGDGGGGGCGCRSGGGGGGLLVLILVIAIGRHKRLALALLALTACGAAAHPKANPAEHQLDVAIDTFYPAHLDFRPTFAINLGYHDYDGKVPDRSEAALEGEITRLHGAEDTFDAIVNLPPRREIERQVVLAEIHKELFDLEVRKRPWRDPSYYLGPGGYSLYPYIARDYAPLATRGRALLTACQGGPAYYAAADQNLGPALPKLWLMSAQMMLTGTRSFLTHDAVDAFAKLDDTALRDQIDACLTTLDGALGKLGDALAARVPDATDDFRLGADGLLAMLKANEGIDTDLATLQRVAQADLDRNHAAIIAAAQAIDPSRKPEDVIAEVTADKPDLDHLYDVAADDLKTLRAFVIAHHVVSVPSDDLAEVRPSPPWLRGLNFAALGGSGPFEPVPQPSFFYVSPPDPTWPAAQQAAYVPSREDLLFIAAHEVWPGHFVMHMHERALGSKVLETFQTYTTSEGYAHYVEEMMWDQGLGDGDPRVHIGELKNALLRDVRFVVALGLHAGTMTVDEAQSLFETEGFADPGNAKQQAMRGTGDPMFLGYTRGKLAIVKLRDDWMKAHRGATIGEFHDAFLSWGEAPLPVIRKMMLGDADTGALF